MDDKKFKEGFLFRKALWLIPTISIVLAFIGVFIFTLPALSNRFNFLNTGPIGDTIGGITAPIFNLISGVIIFYSFREQLRANRIQSDALKSENIRSNQLREYERIVDLLEELKFELDNLKISIRHIRFNDSSTLVFSGVKALEYLDNNFPEFNKNPISKVHKELLDRVVDFLYLMSSIGAFIRDYDATGDTNAKKVIILKYLHTYYKIRNILVSIKNKNDPNDNQDELNFLNLSINQVILYSSMMESSKNILYKEFYDNKG
jgi:hypothetical protein